MNGIRHPVRYDIAANNSNFDMQLFTLKAMKNGSGTPPK